MPIIINLDVMLAKRKMSLSELAATLDLTLTHLSLVKTGNVKAIRLSTLDDLCRVLDCKPGDLLDYVTEKEYKKLFGRGSGG